MVRDAWRFGLIGAALGGLCGGCSGSGVQTPLIASEVRSPSASPVASLAPGARSPAPEPLTPPAGPGDAIVQSQIQQYLHKLAGKGFGPTRQGVWMQADSKTLLANHQGTTLLSAASLTKVATSLAVLQTFGVDHRFVTVLGSAGTVQNGVLQGDLVVQGGEDPLLVWEDAIALGNLLNQRGIRQVTGNLVIVGKFYMNFAPDPAQSGAFLKEGLNATAWGSDAVTQYQTLPVGTPRPQVMIQGAVRVVPSLPGSVRPWVKHESLPVAELLKKMNQYSNNLMADMLAEAVGGAAVVRQKVVQATGLPATEISLVNGSGLGEANRISPRMVCAMFRFIDHHLQAQQMTVGDLFTVVGRDEGVLSERSLPALAIVKSGSLDQVSALAGVLSTQKQGTVWFAIQNGGADNLDGFRAEQEALLEQFVGQWGTTTPLPAALAPTAARQNQAPRNQLLP
jgi:serine-type D-Ala-D-Ala carboxypeptidase/endopeptidase (penicillin-binding protein 4)